MLHKLPKFDPMVVVGLSLSPRIMHIDDSSADDDEDNGDIAIVRKKAKVNNDVPPQGSNMEQPEGMKKAKLLKKFEDASVAVAASPFDSLSNNGSNILADNSNATKDLVVAFKASASLKRDELWMRTHDKWMKMATMDMSCGKQDMALMMMQKIQFDDDQATSNNSPPTTIARAALSPAFVDVSAGERTIPNEVEVMATEQEGIDKNSEETAPAPPAEV